MVEEAVSQDNKEDNPDQNRRQYRTLPTKSRVQHQEETEGKEADEEEEEYTCKYNSVEDREVEVEVEEEGKGAQELRRLVGAPGSPLDKGKWGKDKDKR